MVELKVGEIYEVTRARSGTSGNGRSWALASFKESGKGKKEIVMWAESLPDGVVDGTNVMIKRIDSIKYSAKKNSKDEWEDTVSFSGEIEACKENDNGFYDIPDMGDPFDDGGLPF